jgi:hypothetical protein
VSNHRVFEFSLRGASSINCRTEQSDLIRELPDVPVLSGTLLAMELIIGQGSVDLAQVSQLVLSDLGATLQILRQAQRENVMGGSRLERVEDCISGLGLDRCFEAMAKRLITRSTHSACVYSAWHRAREIAVTSKLVAEKLALDVTSEDAYLVGLAHGIGILPQILEWDWITHFGGNSDLAGLRIAQDWRLPRCIVEYFLDRVTCESQTQWTTIVDHALELLDGQPSAVLCDDLIQFPFRTVQEISG